MNNRAIELEFQASFIARQLRNDAKKARRQDGTLRKQIQDLLKKGKKQQAYQKAKLLLAQQSLADKLDNQADQAELQASQMKANNAMNRMTAMVAQSTKVMGAASRSMNSERTLSVLEQNKQQNDELAIKSAMHDQAVADTTSTQVSEDAVHELLGQLADDAGVQLSAEFSAAQPSTAEPVKPQASSEPTAEEEDALQQRLRALRA
ncbi:Snf7 family protein [Apiospora rasikravindrae]|uniref:Snf7 family protein n=1 Tax=Apiospora rasikravindrae TaxID=990691 RepID=A0ABR1S191_9PEZI